MDIWLRVSDLGRGSKELVFRDKDMHLDIAGKQTQQPQCTHIHFKCGVLVLKLTSNPNCSETNGMVSKPTLQ